MKKNLLFICLSLTMMLTGVIKIVNAQSIPNGNFESWTTGIYNAPANYIQNSNAQNFFAGLPFNVVREDTGTYSGCTYDAQLTTVGSGSNISFGYFVNTAAQNGDPLTWTGGFPYTHAPTGIRGWYKSDIQPGDTALVFCIFRSGGSPIGQGEVKLTGTHSAWTLFTASITIVGTPDSVIIGATSSDALNNIAITGSTITLDSISFTGVSSQPPLLDGNFANWDTDTLASANSWYTNTGNNGATGVTRTTDAHNGQYAVELTTYLGKNNNQPAAQAAYISTGYNQQNCNGNCPQLGGYPDTIQVDTLVFWYNYVPSGSDSAQVNLTFKKNGSSIWMSGQNLGPTSGYQEVELPIAVGQALDTIVVSFQSSIYQDSTVNYVGSDLKVDLVYLTSQPLATGIMESIANNKILLYPNPLATTATLEIDRQVNLQGTELRMTDVLGRTVKTMGITEHTTTIGKGNLSPGVYFYELINNSSILKAGKIIIE